jgi:hypothetical protein
MASVAHQLKNHIARASTAQSVMLASIRAPYPQLDQVLGVQTRCGQVRALLDKRVGDAVSRACLLLGRLDEARRLGDCSVESSRRKPGFAAHALHLLGDIATHPDRFDAENGAAYYRRALALAELHGMRPLVAHCHLGLGKLYGRIGKPEHARENLTAATTMYREMDMDFWLEREVR